MAYHSEKHDQFNFVLYFWNQAWLSQSRERYLLASNHVCLHKLTDRLLRWYVGSEIKLQIRAVQPTRYSSDHQLANQRRQSYGARLEFPLNLSRTGWSPEPSLAKTSSLVEKILKRQAIQQRSERQRGHLVCLSVWGWISFDRWSNFFKVDYLRQGITSCLHWYFFGYQIFL